jgi:hypothetical protein
MTRMTTAASALHALEACLAELGPQMKAAVPQQHAKAQQLVSALRAGESRVDEVRRLSLELMQWQAGLQKAAFELQLAALAPLIERRDPAALASEKALRASIALLTRSLELTKDPTRQRPASEQAAFAKLAQEAERTSLAAGEAILRSASPIALRPVVKQPRSSQGVTLRPVQPPSAKDPQPLAAFKLRPGAIPGASKSSSRR